jgi:hypothetical protein
LEGRVRRKNDALRGTLWLGQITTESPRQSMPIHPESKQ